MKTTTKLAMAAAFTALAACGSNNNTNNAAVDMNATDMNAGYTDMNATADMNATTDMNATGNTDLNAAANTTTNATTNY